MFSLYSCSNGVGCCQFSKIFIKSYPINFLFLLIKVMKQTLIFSGLLISACLAIYFKEQDNHLGYFWFKGLATLLVIGIAVVFDGSMHGFRKTILLGLVFCLLGDLLLVFDAYFIPGLISFLVAHLIFIYAYYRLNTFLWNASSLVLIIAISASFFWWIHEGLGELIIPVLLYMLVISTMVWQGINAYLVGRNRVTTFLALGSVFFLISDALLAFDKFHQHFAYANMAILTTYWIAVTAIAYASTKTE